MERETGAFISIRDASEMTGLSEKTLRAWERRYGFPKPARLPGGHRRFTATDIELVRQIRRDRDAGLGLRAAIDRARRRAERPDGSIFVALRRFRPTLVPQRLAKRELLRISHAMEDECLLWAERPILLACFQRERFYLRARSRWVELSRAARLAIVCARFRGASKPPKRLALAHLREDDPLCREWVIAGLAPNYSACLAAWECPAPERAGASDRRFEVIWTAEAEAVRHVFEVAVGALAGTPEVARKLSEQLRDMPLTIQVGPDTMTALANRMIAYLAR